MHLHTPIDTNMSERKEQTAYLLQVTIICFTQGLVDCVLLSS